MALPKKWNIELAGEYNSTREDGYYKYVSNYSISAGIKKLFLEKKLTISLLASASQLPYWRKDIFLYTRYIVTFSDDARYFMISINYKLGNSKKNNLIRKSGIDSEKNRIND